MHQNRQVIARYLVIVALLSIGSILSSQAQISLPELKQGFRSSA